MADVDGLMTVGQVAERLEAPLHRVKYAIDAYGIAPAGRVGILRVWSEDDLPQIRNALRRTEERQGGRL